MHKNWQGKPFFCQRQFVFSVDLYARAFALPKTSGWSKSGPSVIKENIEGGLHGG
jgi:hypothetical protein